MSRKTEGADVTLPDLKGYAFSQVLQPGFCLWFQFHASLIFVSQEEWVQRPASIAEIAECVARTDWAASRQIICFVSHEPEQD